MRKKKVACLLACSLAYAVIFATIPFALDIIYK